MNENSKKIILDLCGGTGSWSRPYKDAGYDVRLITLPKYDILKTEFYPRHMFFPDDKGGGLEIGYGVHGILAAPPCTMFSRARTNAIEPRDLEAAMRPVEYIMHIIWKARAHPHSRLAWWAIENPVGYLRHFLGQPAFTFQPYEFGHPYQKPTDLFGHFEKPAKGPIVRLSAEHIKKSQLNLRDLPKIPKGYRLDGVRKDSIARAITPSGFAKAFFKANP